MKKGMTIAIAQLLILSLQAQNQKIQFIDSISHGIHMDNIILLFSEFTILVMQRVLNFSGGIHVILIKKNNLQRLAVAVEFKKLFQLSPQRDPFLFMSETDIPPKLERLAASRLAAVPFIDLSAIIGTGVIRIYYQGCWPCI